MSATTEQDDEQEYKNNEEPSDDDKMEGQGSDMEEDEDEEEVVVVVGEITKDGPTQAREGGTWLRLERQRGQACKEFSNTNSIKTPSNHQQRGESRRSGTKQGISTTFNKDMENRLNSNIRIPQRRMNTCVWWDGKQKYAELLPRTTALRSKPKFSN